MLATEEDSKQADVKYNVFIVTTKENKAEPGARVTGAAVLQ